ncbi:MAG: hypothetical protein Q8K55_08970 [Gemmatimonadaceae bacterium]|nr:hypothetical protein [Gemmatimonadaceae bacterium]
MKRVALLLLPFAAACASLPGGGADTGAESPNAAIQQFLAATRRKDLTAMASVWGTEKGPASKNMSQQELERRELIMIQCLPHDQATLGAPAPSEAGRLRIPVDLTLLALKAKPVFTVVRGPKDRWYVENFEIDQLRDQGFCGAATASPAPPPEPPPGPR